MFDKKLLALAPGALRNVVIAVLFMWVGLIGDILLVLGVVGFLSLVLGSAFISPQLSLLACAASLVLKALSTKVSSSFKNYERGK